VSTFSIVIATRNRESLLAQTLEALFAQTWPRDQFEIIVADNGSTDRTAAVLEAARVRTDGPVVHPLHVPTPGKSHAVNAAVAVSKADFIAYTDDDVRPEPAWLERLAAAFDETGADFVAGRVLPIWAAPRPAWLSPAVYGVLAVPENGDDRVEISKGGRQDIMPIGANMAVRRRVIERLEGLRSDLGKLEGSLRGAEDHEFFLRMLHAGFRGVYEPTAVVHHWVPTGRLSRAYFRRWFFQNGKDVARLEPAFPSPWTRLLGLPRYLWREAASDSASLVAATVRRNAAERFRAATRLLWFSGYLVESWRAPMRLRGRASDRSQAG
jgi:glucosyl-dolichyl phosphate glucuronosyltransferase